jgi:hypothetical protein
MSRVFGIPVYCKKAFRASLYGLPKIHKEGIPLRPIVNTIGSPTYELESYVAKILGPLVGGTESYIKDSNDFVNLIKE